MSIFNYTICSKLFNPRSSGDANTQPVKSALPLSSSSTVTFRHHARQRRHHKARPLPPPSPPQATYPQPQPPQRKPVHSHHGLCSRYAPLPHFIHPSTGSIRFPPLSCPRRPRKKISAADFWSTACWASTGHSVAGCAAIEAQLRACMDTPRPKNEKKSTINYHLMRLYPKISPPTKRK